MARQLKKLKAKWEPHPQYKVPSRIYDMKVPATKKKPREAAEALLKTIADDLQISKDLSDLKFDKVKETVLGTHVFFQQHHNGTPISGAWVRVDFDKSNAVYNIESSLVPKKFIDKSDQLSKAKRKNIARAAADSHADPEIPQERAQTIACEASKDAAHPKVKPIDSEKVLYVDDGVPKPAWKVTVVSDGSRAGEWKLYIDALSGNVLEKIDLIKRQNGKGKVFDPNPVVTLNDTSLKDDSQIPDSAYVEVTLRDLESSGFLDGPFVSTRTTGNRVKRSDLVFTFVRANRSFKEVMVYFHIDRFQRYVQDLGIGNALNKQVEVNVDGIPEDNSFYSSITKSLTFGRGGVDDAEDADIILHEYGHAMQDDMVPGFGPSSEARAMGEGYGDYLAGSFFADVKADRLKPCVGPWDAVAYSGDDPPNLRRLDSNKKYPRDVVGEEHADGEMWSACLWEIRSAIGGRTADQLIIAHHFQLPGARATFEQAGKALITADQQLNAGRHESVIRDVFVRRGIFPNPKRKNRRAGASLHATHVHGK